MIKYKEVKEMRSITRIAKVVCNKCGKSIKKDLNLGYNQVSIEHDFGYNSSYDLQTHSFDLCEPCYTKFIKTFKVKITIEEDGELL